MNTYEIRWKPAGINWNYGVRADVIKANFMEEAERIVEAQAKMLGASSVEWYGKRQIAQKALFIEKENSYGKF